MKKSDIRQSHWLHVGLVNIHMYAKKYQNIPSGLKVHVIPRIQFLKILSWQRLFIKKTGIGLS